MKRKILLSLGLAAFAASGAVFAQTYVLNHGVDLDGNLTKMRTNAAGSVTTVSTPASATFTQTTTAICTAPCPGTPCSSVEFNTSPDCVSLLDPIDLALYPNVNIQLVNNSAAQTLTNCIVAWSNDGTYWEDWDETTFASLAPSDIKSMNISGSGRRWLKIVGQTTNTTTGVNVIVTVHANTGG